MTMDDLTPEEQRLVKAYRSLAPEPVARQRPPIEIRIDWEPWKSFAVFKIEDREGRLYADKKVFTDLDDALTEYEKLLSDTFDPLGVSAFSIQRAVRDADQRLRPVTHSRFFA